MPISKNEFPRVSVFSQRLEIPWLGLLALSDDNEILLTFFPAQVELFGEVLDGASSISAPFHFPL